jgi:hypothetical protein
MILPTQYIEVDLFSEEVNGEDHPDALRFKEVLLQVADEYNCCLTSFEVDHGTVSFSFDSEELMAEIVGILQEDREDPS